jgi:hypothetical protein
VVIMRQTSEEQRPAVPGVIATLTAGLELTTGNLWLIVLPILVDIFYWLGPRLSVRVLVEGAAASLQSDPALAELASQLEQLATQFNVFTTLSLPLIGIPALMSGPIPESTPLSVRVMEIDNFLLWLALFASLSVLGLLMASLYLGLIGLALWRMADGERPRFWRFMQSLVVNAVRLFGLGILFMIVLVLVSLPLLPVAALLGLLASSLFLGVMMLGFVLVATYIFLAVPGIILNGRPLVSAVVESIQLVHRNILQTVNLLLLIVLISSGMNLLWHLADDGSWLTAISIAGHGFVSTALAAAIFIYYRDRFNVLRPARS